MGMHALTPGLERSMDMDIYRNQVEESVIGERPEDQSPEMADRSQQGIEASFGPQALYWGQAAS
jgi:hypothetical protein